MSGRRLASVILVNFSAIIFSHPTTQVSQFFPLRLSFSLNDCSNKKKFILESSRKTHPSAFIQHYASVGLFPTQRPPENIGKVEKLCVMI